MRSWLIAIAIGGNVAVWSVAYIGYTRDDDHALKQESGREQPVNLRTFAFLAPTRTQSGQSIPRTPITVTLDLMDPSRVGHICHMSPRIRDAMIQFLFRRPVVMGLDGERKLDELRPHLTAVANHAIGEHLVRDVAVKEGGERRNDAREARYVGEAQCKTIAAEPDANKDGSERRRDQLYVPFGRLTR